MARNSYKTYLMKKGTGDAWAKLIDIKDFPDLGSAPDTLDTTTLSDKAHTYIADIEDTGGALEFTCNYSLEDYNTLAALKGQENDYAIWFGATISNDVATPDGSEGKFLIKGTLDVWVKGAGVSAVVEMGLAITPSVPVTIQSA